MKKNNIPSFPPFQKKEGKERKLKILQWSLTVQDNIVTKNAVGGSSES